MVMVQMGEHVRSMCIQATLAEGAAIAIGLQTVVVAAVGVDCKVSPLAEHALEVESLFFRGEKNVLLDKMVLM